MKTTDTLIPGDAVQVDGGRAALYIGPRTGKRRVRYSRTAGVSAGYTFQNASGVWSKGETGFDRKSCQDWVTVIIRDGVSYRYHPSDWGPLWIK